MRKLGDVEDPQPVAAGADLVVGHEGAVDEDAPAEIPSAGGRWPLKGSVSWLWRSKLRSAIISGMSRSPAAAAARPRTRRRRSTSRPGRASCAERCGRGGGRGTTGTRPVQGARPPQVVDVGFLLARARAAGRCPTGAARGRGGCGRSRRPAGSWSGRPAGRRTGCGCGRRAGGPRARPPAAGSSWWKVTLVRWPARRRTVVARGRCRRRSRASSCGPAGSAASASRIGIWMWAPLSSRGIGSRARKGTAASACGGSSPNGSRPLPPPLSGSSGGERAAAQGAEESSAPQARRE